MAAAVEIASSVSSSETGKAANGELESERWIEEGMERNLIAVFPVQIKVNMPVAFWLRNARGAKVAVLNSEICTKLPVQRRAWHREKDMKIGPTHYLKDMIIVSLLWELTRIMNCTKCLA